MKKKDSHDYIGIYGMLVLTSFMVIATSLIAYSAFIKIPEQIEKSKSTSYFGEWYEFNYEDYFKFQNIEDWLDAGEMANECKNLGKNEQKVLEKSYLICKSKNIEQRMNYVVYKNNESECFFKVDGDCK